MEDLIAGLADGTLNPVIGTEMPLTEAAAAFARVMKSDSYGKVVLTV